MLLEKLKLDIFTTKCSRVINAINTRFVLFKSTNLFSVNYISFKETKELKPSTHDIRIKLTKSSLRVRF